MQESSKGKFPLPKNSDLVDTEMQYPSSAFHFVGKDGKSSRPNSGSKGREKRDSGYATDNSPANFGNNQLLFTFDIENMDRSSDEIPEDKTDEEVEMVLSNENNVLAVSEPISIPGTIHRPSAPVPRATYSEDMHKSTSLPTFYGRSGYCRRNLFRPIESRSVGTQTPSPHSQIISQAISDRFHPYMPNAARVHARLRHYSEGEDVQPEGSPLPDIVQEHRPRDRSVSLPNVPSHHSVAVGRELRRISDEFHFSYTPIRRRGSFINGYHHQSASFPRSSAFNFQNWWENLRSIFSSPDNIPNPATHGSVDDFDVFENEH